MPRKTVSRLSNTGLALAGLTLGLGLTHSQPLSAQFSKYSPYGGYGGYGGSDRGSSSTMTATRRSPTATTAATWCPSSARAFLCWRWSRSMRSASRSTTATAA